MDTFFLANPSPVADAHPHEEVQRDLDSHYLDLCDNLVQYPGLHIVLCR